MIVGGESGPGARAVKEEWIEGIREQCEKAKVPFFFKQWSGPDVHRKGHLLRGREYREYPKIEEENVECPILNFECEGNRTNTQH